MNRIYTHPRFGSLRWARFTFSDGSYKSVLQQSWITDWREVDEHGDTTEAGTDIEWRDVPIWLTPYEPVK